MVQEVRDQEDGRSDESRQHTGAMSSNPATTYKDEARDEKKPARRIQDCVDMRKGKDEILHAESRAGRVASPDLFGRW